MTTIIQKEKFCKIIEELDADFFKLLNNHMSYKVAGVEFLPQYKRFQWDGIERLISKKLEFYSGLLNYVKDFYKLHNKELTIIDERKPIIYNEPIDILPNLKKLGITPYDYQLRSAELVKTHTKLILHHATGGGKSVEAAIMTATINKTTMISVISKELLHQFHKFFSQVFNEEIGIIGDGQCIIKPISIVSIWTASRALGIKSKDLIIDDQKSDEDFDENNSEKIKRYLKTVKLNIIDECHIAAAKSVKVLHKYIDNEITVGLSGTPIRDDNQDLILTGILGDFYDRVSASELIRRGILASPRIKFLYVPGYANFTTNYNTVYADHIVNNVYRNNLIVGETKKLLDKGYQVLVLFKTIKHGKIICDLFKDQNIDIEFLSGKDTEKKRAAVKENLLSKKSMLAVCSVIYDVGIDVKTLNALVLCGAGRSTVKTLQRIGRVIRSNGPEKTSAAIIDFYDDIRYLKKHSLIRKAIYETEPEFVIKMPEIKKK